MNAGNIRITANLVGIQKTVDLAREANGGSAWTPDTVAGVPGEVATKADANTCTVTLEEGHGLVTGTFDVFWDGGRRYAVPGTVADNTLSLDGGGGNDFPVVTTDVVIGTPVEVDVQFDPDDLSTLVIMPGKRACVTFLDDSDAVIGSFDVPANGLCLWTEDTGIACPLTGNAIEKIMVSTGEESTDTVTIGILYTSTT